MQCSFLFVFQNVPYCSNVVNKSCSKSVQANVVNQNVTESVKFLRIYRQEAYALLDVTAKDLTPYIRN